MVLQKNQKEFLKGLKSSVNAGRWLTINEGDMVIRIIESNKYNQTDKVPLENIIKYYKEHEYMYGTIKNPLQ